MEAIVFAGGLGTRLAEALPHLPKALAPIQEKPFLKILIDQLHRWGRLSRLILATGYRATFIEDYIKGLHYPFSIECSFESTPLGTGGALLQALPKLRGETFLAMNGDSFFDLPLDPFLEFHREKKASISIGCLEVEETSRYGSLSMDSFSQITSFVEKSSSNGQGWINGGVYLMEKRALQTLPLIPCSLEKEIFPQLPDIYGYAHQATFIDIGTPRSLLEAENLLKDFVS